MIFRNKGAWLRAGLVLLIIALLCLFWKVPVRAHESWISKGNLKNAAGEWCCGDGDCFVIDSDRVIYRNGNFNIYHSRDFDDDPLILMEVIPEAEAQPSPDGQFWRCRRPDGTRRCFFAPPPNS